MLTTQLEEGVGPHLTFCDQIFFLNNTRTLLLTLKNVVHKTVTPQGHLGRAHRRHGEIVFADFYPVN